MRADLHLHSHYSDGTSSPRELLDLAVKHKLTTLAVVDHDTFAGLQECQEVFALAPVNLIEGIEISAFDYKRGRKVHILGYNITKRQYVECLCEPMLKARTANTLYQLKQIQGEGYQIDEAAVRSFAEKATALYKQHLMAALIEAGYTKEIYGPLYQKLFKNQGIAQVDIEYVDVYEAVEAIKLGGGKVVVAHPGQLDSYELITELASYCLDGIEKYHPDHTLKDQKKVQELADRYHVATFGGSDFHGAFGPDFLGTSLLQDVREFPSFLEAANLAPFS